MRQMFGMYASMERKPYSGRRTIVWNIAGVAAMLVLVVVSALSTSARQADLDSEYERFKGSYVIIDGEKDSDMKSAYPMLRIEEARAAKAVARHSTKAMVALQRIFDQTAATCGKQSHQVVEKSGAEGSNQWQRTDVITWNSDMNLGRRVLNGFKGEVELQLIGNSVYTITLGDDAYRCTYTLVYDPQLPQWMLTRKMSSSK